jgi:glycosyltransferase involved in cell wall biosynthesis
LWKITLLIKKGINYLHRNGISKTVHKVCRFLTGHHGQIIRRPKEWIPTSKVLQEQRNSVFPSSPLFSVIVPLYNTSERFLTEMMDSVREQTYENWELCLADGSDAEHINVQQICCRYAEKDSRIKYRKLEKNLGISENTNQCLEMSSGDYICLLDHDDVLHPCALFEAVKAICEKNADFIYTDEATFHNNLDKIISTHFKPDFAPDNLRANNYICHLTIFKKSLLQEAGMFRKEYDGSQDHDMVLRLTHIARKIVHIPKVLYYWRSHEDSVASDIYSKTYAIEAGKKAVTDHILQCGQKAIVESSEAFPAIYRIRYELEEKPLISIIISDNSVRKSLKKCVSSLKVSSYSNYEILMFNSAEASKSLEKIKQPPQLRICTVKKPSNPCAAVNVLAQQARGKYLLLLDGNLQVRSPEWLEEMLMYAQRSDVGAVGAKLYYKNGKVQHAGMILGTGKNGIVSCAFDGFGKTDIGYMGRLSYAQNVSAVTGSCMLVRKSLFWEGWMKICLFLTMSIFVCGCAKWDI